MAVVKVYDQKNAEVGSLELDPRVFEVEIQPEILNLVVRAQRAAARAGTHATKTRSTISGGGIKPWRQKGTGRARSGSNRSPIWRHGAVTFGPQPRSYGFKVNKKVRSLAMRMALSAHLAEESLFVLDNISLPEIKTKHFCEVVNAFDFKKALIILKKEDNIIRLSSRNIPGVKVMTPEQLNVYDILKYDQLVLLKDAVKCVEGRFTLEEQAD